ncbi:MAG: PEP-CTERM sorting domain-containing protein [Myxococcota bacterium]
MYLFRVSLVAILAALVCSTSASAITYQLLDHGYGALGPDYGLRVDSAGEVFSVEIGSANIILDWDGGSTATISGTLNANTASGNGGVGPTWTVNYVLTGVTASGGGFVATGGSGVLTDPSANDTALVAEINGSGYAFQLLADGHRLPGDNSSLVARGWLLPPSSTDDWLVRAAVIPEPGTALLLGLGLAALSGARRR